MNIIGKFFGWSIGLFIVIMIAYVAIAAFTAPFASYPLIADFESFLNGTKMILIISLVLSIFITMGSK